MGRIKTKTNSIAGSSLNHRASSVDTKELKVIVYIYSSTWRLVTSVQPAPPYLPHHDVAGPTWSLDMELFKAETGCEAGLGGADVAVHSCPMDWEEPAI
jgi:hypothetical protein